MVNNKQPKNVFDAATFIYRRGGSKDIPTYNITKNNKKQKIDGTEVRKVLTHSVDNGIECGFSQACIPASFDIVSSFHYEYEKSWSKSRLAKEHGENYYRLCFKEHYYEDMKLVPLNLQIDFNFVVGDQFESLTEAEKTTYLYRLSLEFIAEIHEKAKEVFSKGELYNSDGPHAETFYTLEDHALFILISEPLYSEISSVTTTKTCSIRFVYYWPNLSVTEKEWTKFRNFSVSQLGHKYCEREDEEKRLSRTKEWNEMVSDELVRYLPGSSELEFCGHGNDCIVHLHGKKVKMNAVELVFVLDSQLRHHADVVSSFNSSNVKRRKLLDYFCTLNLNPSYKHASCKFSETDFVHPGVTLLVGDNARSARGVFKILTTTDKRNRNKNYKKKTKKLTPEAINLMTSLCGVYGIKSNDFVLDMTYQNPCIVITEATDKYCPFSQTFYSCNCSGKYIIDFKIVPIGVHKMCGCSCGNSSHYECRGKCRFYCDPGVSIMTKLMEEVGCSHKKSMYNVRNDETNVIERHNGCGNKTFVKDFIDEINLRSSDKFILLK